MTKMFFFVLSMGGLVALTSTEIFSMEAPRDASSEDVKTEVAASGTNGGIDMTRDYVYGNPDASLVLELDNLLQLATQNPPEFKRVIGLLDRGHARLTTNVIGIGRLSEAINTCARSK